MLSAAESSECGSAPGTGSSSDCSTAMAVPMPNTCNAWGATVPGITTIAFGVAKFMLSIYCKPIQRTGGHGLLESKVTMSLEDRKHQRVLPSGHHPQHKSQRIASSKTTKEHQLCV